MASRLFLMLSVLLSAVLFYLPISAQDRPVRPEVRRESARETETRRRQEVRTERVETERRVETDRTSARDLTRETRTGERDTANTLEVGEGRNRFGNLEYSTTTSSQADLRPGTTEHKNQRWTEYRERGGQWTYGRWSAVYEVNMDRAREADKVAADYQKKLGWGKREVTVKVEGVDRRLDIADVGRQRAVEVKSGDQYLTEANLWEIMRDEALVKRGWQVEWHFSGYASKPLREELRRAGIKVTGVSEKVQ